MKPLDHLFTGGHYEQAFDGEAVVGKDVIVYPAWGFSRDPWAIFGGEIKERINVLEAASSRTRNFIETSPAALQG